MKLQEQLLTNGKISRGGNFLYQAVQSKKASAEQTCHSFHICKHVHRLAKLLELKEVGERMFAPIFPMVKNK